MDHKIDPGSERPFKSGSEYRPARGSSAKSPYTQYSESLLSFSITSVFVEPGDQPTYTMGQKVGALEVRELGELIRKRYALDVQIWSQKNCRPRYRHLVEDLMRRSDAALSKIISIVYAWDSPEKWESPADWQRLKAIRERLEMDGKRLWANNPPWAEEA